MSIAIVTGIFTIFGGAAGTAITAFLQRSADRRADQSQVADLFTRTVKAVTVMEAERILFRHRRGGLNANLIAIGNIAIQSLAAKISSGDWAGGLARGFSGMTAWDAAEGARFSDRYLAARAEAATVLVQISLMSEALQQAASGVSDALEAMATARKPRDKDAAGKQAARAVAELRTAVRDYRAGSSRKRGKRRAPALPARQ